MGAVREPDCGQIMPKTIMTALGPVTYGDRSNPNPGLGDAYLRLGPH